MSLRYYIEALIFIAMLCVFQIEISKFNREVQISVVELREYSLMANELEVRGGKIYGHDVEEQYYLDLIA